MNLIIKSALSNMKAVNKNFDEIILDKNKKVNLWKVKLTLNLNPALFVVDMQ